MVEKTKRRGRRPKVALINQVRGAYLNLHNLDLLQESPLVTLPSVQEGIRPHQFMAEAQALRRLLTEAAEQVIADIEDIQYLAGVKTFLKGYLEGKRVKDIAQDLGVSREWASTKYKREALRLASAQFIANLLPHFDNQL